jgi:hypothetical protein
MGAEGDLAGPDISWSHTGSSIYREWLAQAEEFTLAEMDGFGRDRPWSTVSPTLAPLLDQPDDDGPQPHSCSMTFPQP